MEKKRNLQEKGEGWRQWRGQGKRRKKLLSRQTDKEVPNFVLKPMPVVEEERCRLIDRQTDRQMYRLTVPGLSLPVTPLALLYLPVSLLSFIIILTIYSASFLHAGGLP